MTDVFVGHPHRIEEEKNKLRIGFVDWVANLIRRLKAQCCRDVDVIKFDPSVLL